MADFQVLPPCTTAASLGAYRTDGEILNVVASFLSCVV